jgi:uncharacterized protein (DUF697 family)
MAFNFERANDLVDRYSWWAAGLGLVPLPLVDVAAITGLQIKLVHSLASKYGQDPKITRIRSLVGALFGSLVPVALGATSASALKAIPIIGPIVGIAVIPAFAVAATRAIGRVFVMHFESGGTLLDFDPEEMRQKCTDLYLAQYPNYRPKPVSVESFSSKAAGTHDEHITAGEELAAAQ